MNVLRSICLCMLAVVLSAAPVAAGEWRVDGFTFSDELGGFEIIAASGRGTDADPFVVVQRLHEAAPVTMVIRTHDKTDHNGELKPQLFVQFSLVVVVTNASKRNWAGFDLELQEKQGKPSIYFDGLSFDQLRTFDKRVFHSDRFSVFSDLTEPYDRIRFEQGFVVPNDTVKFQVYITDVTPTDVFYLVQDPQILLAGQPLAGRTIAGLNTNYKGLKP